VALIEELVKKGILAKEDALSLEKEVKASGQKEEELILGKKIVSEDFLFNLKADYLKIPLRKIKAEDIPLKILEQIPEETANFYQMVPLAKKGDVLEVGMVYPEDLSAQEVLNFLARRGKFSYRVFLITETDFKNILNRYKTPKREVGKALEELEVELKEKTVSKLAEIEKLVEEAPISKMVAVILRYGVEGNSSDIHIEPFKDKLRVRYRSLGILHSSIFLPIRLLPAIVSRIKILANLRIDETRIPQDGRFSTRFQDRNIDFRVSTFPTAMGEKVALRILDPKVGLKRFEELGLSGRNLEVVETAIKKPYGMILSVGPTGSGKTTTLYAILQLLNKEGVNIVTLEDPVEYFIEGINQSQVKPEIGYDFSRGLKQIVRQDPDIIMVGEIRDSETAALATHAALTGHLVLSTLHTNNALGVIPRLIDLGVQPFLLPSALSLTIAQRLVRKLCPNCKKEIRPKREIRELILKEIDNLPEKVKREIKIPESLTIFEPVGCPNCQNTGFSGRIAIFEILEMTPQLAEIILEEPSEAKILEEAKRQGMLTMRQDGILKVLDGITSIEEVLRETEGTQPINE
jgi:type IV pilus assembly protein PilB